MVRKSRELGGVGIIVFLIVFQLTLVFAFASIAGLEGPSGFFNFIFGDSRILGVLAISVFAFFLSSLKKGDISSFLSKRNVFISLLVVGLILLWGFNNSVSFVSEGDSDIDCSFDVIGGGNNELVVAFPSCEVKDSVFLCFGESESVVEEGLSVVLSNGNSSVVKSVVRPVSDQIVNGAVSLDCVSGVESSSLLEFFDGSNKIKEFSIVPIDVRS